MGKSRLLEEARAPASDLGLRILDRLPWGLAAALAPAILTWDRLVPDASSFRTDRTPGTLRDALTEVASGWGPSGRFKSGLPDQRDR